MCWLQNLNYQLGDFLDTESQFLFISASGLVIISIRIEKGSFSESELYPSGRIYNYFSRKPTIALQIYVVFTAIRLTCFTSTVGCATTKGPTTNECYNVQFL
jgi:hypothetical protein